MVRWRGLGREAGAEDVAEPPGELGGLGGGERRSAKS